LLGDSMYGTKRNHGTRRLESGDPGIQLLSRQALHAEKLTINHLRTGKPIQFTAPLPEDLVALRDYLRRNQTGLPNDFLNGVDKSLTLKYHNPQIDFDHKP